VWYGAGSRKTVVQTEALWLKKKKSTNSVKLEMIGIKVTVRSIAWTSMAKHLKIDRPAAFQAKHKSQNGISSRGKCECTNYYSVC
jgi:hypothetical protein